MQLNHKLPLAALAVLAAASPVAMAAPASAATTTTAYLTGYTWYDNTPAGTAQIARPVIHSHADGTGTYDDPITAAVAAPGGDWKLEPGTRIYVPSLQKYFIVEDMGDSAMAHPPTGSIWLDLWIDGEGSGHTASDRCASSITGGHQVVIDPSRGLPVVEGDMMSDGCASVGSDSVPTAKKVVAAPTVKAMALASEDDSDKSEADDSADQADTKADGSEAKAETKSLPEQASPKAVAATAKKAVEASAKRVATTDYTVVKGDTLTAIAQAHDTDVDTLVKLNKIDDPNMLEIGQQLKLPVTDTTDAQLASAAPRRAKTHVVKAGETLTSIAKAEKVSGGWEKVFELNDNKIDDPHEIYVGQRFILNEAA